MRETNDSISKPGYLKQRMKLNPGAIRYLCDFHNASIYREEEMLTLKGYLVLAADGSNINIPTTPETLATFGTSSRQGTKRQAALGLSCLYDLMNKAILDTTVNRVKFDERAQARTHMEHFSQIAGGKKSIIVLDRNYPSAFDFIHWQEVGQKFVIRLKKSDYKKERAMMAYGDETIEVALDAARTNPFKGTDAWDALARKGSFSLRIVNVTGDVSLATNLCAEEFSAAEIGQIYTMRWGIETAFDTLKNNLQIENFTGTKPVLIEQDIYASIYLCNLAQDMIADAEAANAASGKLPGKHRMAVNKAFAVGILKEELVRAVIEPDLDERERIFNKMVAEIQSQVLPVRPGRRYPRNNNMSHSKNSNTHKRSF